MKKIFILFVACILHLSVEEILTETLSNSIIGGRSKELISKNQIKSKDNGFFGTLLIPYIICFFAATGIWPFYPQNMQGRVNQMGQQIFAQSDEEIKSFCKGKFSFNFHQSHRPIFIKGIFLPAIFEEIPTSTMTSSTKQDTTIAPITDPPVTEPPVTEPPITEPPITEPPVTEPPVTEPPVTEPPVTEPPVTEPPVTEPPVTAPPVTVTPETYPCCCRVPRCRRSYNLKHIIATQEINPKL